MLTHAGVCINQVQRYAQETWKAIQTPARPISQVDAGIYVYICAYMCVCIYIQTPARPISQVDAGLYIDIDIDIDIDI